MRAKYETNVKPHLDAIRGMAINGDSDKDIADRLDISVHTLWAYKSKYVELYQALMPTREIADRNVLNAYYRRTTGEWVTEVKKRYEYRLNKKTGQYDRVLVGEEEQTKYIPADPRAAENWLRFRQRAAWSAMAEQIEQGDNPVILLPEIKEVTDDGGDTQDK